MGRAGHHPIDRAGKPIRGAMKAHNISDKWVVSEPGFATPERQISVAAASDPPERTSVLMSGSARQLDRIQTVRNFQPIVKETGLVFAEIGAVSSGRAHMFLRGRFDGDCLHAA
jgi:hypothetical protein